jgi:dTDP-4-amino-4,6-dideoxygalactose transaminase
MGRDALSLAVTLLDLKVDDTVVLPVYTCQDVLRSFVRKCNVVFYDVEPDLTILPAVLRAKLQGPGRIRMVLITNYFGFLQPHRDEIKQLCAERDVCLIEDCAHSLLTQGSGETGDMSIYSFRKVLPIRDGGGLGMRGNGKLPLPRYHHGIYSDSLSFLAFAKSLLNIHTEKFSRACIASQTAQVLPLPTKDSRILPMSHFARRSMRSISLNDVLKKRRDDYRFWQDTIRENPSLTAMFGDLPSGVCPLGFVLTTKNRDSLEASAREKGISLRVHWRLDPGLGSDCTTSHALSKEMLTLPVYPELSVRDRQLLTSVMAQR